MVYDIQPIANSPNLIANFNHVLSLQNAVLWNGAATPTNISANQETTALSQD